MAEHGLKYSGIVVTDSGFDAEGIANNGAATGDDYDMNNIILRRFTFRIVFAGSAFAGITIYFRSKDGTDYSTRNSAYHKLFVPPVSGGGTEIVVFMAMATDTPREFQIDVQNDSGGTATVTVTSETAVFSDQLT